MHEKDHIQQAVAAEIDRRERAAAAEKRMADLEATVQAQSGMIASLWQAVEAFCGRIEWGVCPVTLKAPQVVNSIASLASVEGVVRTGQRFLVLVGGSNGPELHEAAEVDSQGRIVQTAVVKGSDVFVVQKSYRVRSGGGI